MLANHVSCPHCHAMMEPRNRHGVQFEFCPDCRGVWLERGRLDTIVERSGRFIEVQPASARDRRTGSSGRHLPCDGLDDP